MIAKARSHVAVAFLTVGCIVFSGSSTNAITPGATPSFGVLGPLFISSQQEWDDFDAMLSEAKAIGVQRVTIDVWLGVVQPTSAEDYDWSYYDKVFGMIRDHGLKIVPIMAFHKCGGGPGDACNIPLPAWVFTLAPDMKYESGRGHIHDDAIAVWATKEPAVLAAFRNFMQNFGAHFSGFSNDFAEINISLGPTGELRYPSFNSDEWTYPQEGVFQFYSQRAGDDFRRWALNRFGGLCQSAMGG